LFRGNKLISHGTTVPIMGCWITCLSCNTVTLRCLAGRCRFGPFPALLTKVSQYLFALLCPHVAFLLSFTGWPGTRQCVVPFGIACVESRVRTLAAKLGGFVAAFEAQSMGWACWWWDHASYKRSPLLFDG
jgi:hypothetical protein